ncbi:MAG TPA: Gfo/Idh/MocA family oxidoreductase [Terracidiphilus sp.]|nr:Gfo/Idh/MocA family oxidoreductase [Terracidiphilus sp.]
MTTINWVLAGVGDIARRRVLPAILAERRSALYGLVTRDRAKAEDYPGTKAWSTLEEALHDSAVDAVYIALPVAMHAEAAIAALRAGKHVLCEKPMAMNDTEAARMVAEAQSSGRLLGVAYYRRLYPKLVRAKQLIAEGAIGQPVLVEANCHSWLPPESRGWLCDPAMAGGGPLYDIASHRLDAMNFLFGKPERVIGLLSNTVQRLAVEDAATLVLRFACAIHGIVDARWNSHQPRDQFRVIGTEGELNLDRLNGPELRLNTRAGAQVEMLPAHANVHYPLVLNFAGAVLANRPAALTCSAEEARWVDWTIEQAMRAQSPA